MLRPLIFLITSAIYFTKYSPSPMLNKIFRLAIFLGYSWLIYNSYIFIGAPAIIYLGAFDLFLFYIKMLAAPLFLPFVLYKGVLVDGMEFFAILLVLLFAVFLPFYRWFIKQTIPRAALLSFTGLFCGPGAVFFLPLSDLRGPITGIVIFYCMWTFYFFLFIGNRLQKLDFPHNRIANAIRAILQWPCLRHRREPEAKLPQAD